MGYAGGGGCWEGVGEVEGVLRGRNAVEGMWWDCVLHGFWSEELELSPCAQTWLGLGAITLIVESESEGWM